MTSEDFEKRIAKLRSLGMTKEQARNTAIGWAKRNNVEFDKRPEKLSYNVPHDAPKNTAKAESRNWSRAWRGQSIIASSWRKHAKTQNANHQTDSEELGQWDENRRSNKSRHSGARIHDGHFRDDSHKSHKTSAKRVAKDFDDVNRNFRDAFKAEFDEQNPCGDAHRTALYEEYRSRGLEWFDAARKVRCRLAMYKRFLKSCDGSHELAMKEIDQAFGET